MINYRILPNQRLIVICNWGDTSLEEIFKFSQKLLADPDYVADYDYIADNTHLHRHFTNNELRNLTNRRMIKKDRLPIKIAIIAPKDISFGIYRMYEMLGENDASIEVCVFRAISPAIVWLDRKEIDIESIIKDIMRTAK